MSNALNMTQTEASSWDTPATQSYGEDTIGTIMDLRPATLNSTLTVRAAIEHLRELVKNRLITYGFVVDDHLRLVGVIVMRDLLFAESTATIGSLMISNPFYFRADLPIMDAAKQAITRHFPEYPVCNDQGELIGSVRGERIFQVQAFELSAQAGTMVGVEKEERLHTPWFRSLKLRHPWLQLNLLTAFFAGGVVSIFQSTVDQIVILAVFLPILAGQSGNTGCQALAVTLRGMTLGDFSAKDAPKLLWKEGLLGMLNGTLVGISAAIGMFVLATSQGNPAAFTLSLIVLVAMVGSCTVSGISGALVPLTLRKLGADPATASSIFLTTMTDIASMGLLLSLASAVLLP